MDSFWEPRGTKFPAAPTGAMQMGLGRPDPAVRKHDHEIRDLKAEVRRLKAQLAEMEAES